MYLPLSPLIYRPRGSFQGSSPDLKIRNLTPEKFNVLNTLARNTELYMQDWERYKKLIKTLIVDKVIGLL